MILQKSYKYAILTEHDDELKNVANDLVLLYHTITSKSRNIEIIQICIYLIRIVCYDK